MVTTTTIPHEHATYHRNELLIQHELIRAIENRRIGLRAKEVYTGAQLSRPTFYLHCRNCDDALQRYETRLVYEFQNSSASARLDMLPPDFSLVILMNFIIKHQTYFLANLKNYNFYLLTILLEQIMPTSMQSADQKDLIFRLAIVEAVILYWGIYENFNKAFIPHHVGYIKHSPYTKWT